jgi:hypothetical protein
MSTSLTTNFCVRSDPRLTRIAEPYEPRPSTFSLLYLIISTRRSRHRERYSCLYTDKRRAPVIGPERIQLQTMQQMLPLAVLCVLYALRCCVHGTRKVTSRHLVNPST